jgi:hypothetical protein
LTAFGFILSYSPALVILGAYSDKKMPLAVGMATSGSGVGTLVMTQGVNRLVIAQACWFRLVKAIPLPDNPGLLILIQGTTQLEEKDFKKEFGIGMR